MQGLTAIVAAAMLVVAGVPAAAAVVEGSAESSVQPGARFAGAIAVQGAEVEGELEGRALDRRFAAADSPAERAAVVAETSERARDRLAALRERRETLRERYRNGTISRSEYRARLAQLAAESRSLARRLNETAEVARSLPPAVAREHGVNASAVATLRADASSFGGDEVAEAAREIAGGPVGNGLGGPPEDVGRPDGTGSERADDRGRSTGRGSEGGTPDGASDVRNRTTDQGNATDGRPGGGAADAVDDAVGNATNGTVGGSDDPGDGGPQDDAGDRGQDSTGSNGGDATSTPTPTATTDDS